MKIQILEENNIKENRVFRYTNIEVPDDCDVEVILDRDYELRLKEAKPQDKEKITRHSTLQDMFNRLNRETLNAWRRWNSHQDKYPKVKRFDGKDGYIKFDEDSDTVDSVLEYAAASDNIREFEKNEEYIQTCKFIRENLKKDWADAFIAVVIDDMSVNDYAAKVGTHPSNISHKLNRAKKKLREIIGNPSDFILR